MDAPRFDALTRALSAAGSRRGLLGLLLTLPGLGGLLSFLGAEDTDAKGRRKRRKKRHKHGKGKRKDKRKKRCRKKSRAKICANRCGIVKNKRTCKKKVNCGACCTGLLPTEDLQTAINASPAGGELVLCAGTWLVEATVNITKDLTLRGAGAEQTALDGQHAVRVLQIGAGAEVTLEHLTITHGKAEGDDFPDFAGGGIFNAGTLTLRHAAVTSSTAAYSGGIANDENSTLTLEVGSRVAGNTATNNGGGIGNFGTLILAADSLVGGDTPADANTASDEGGGIVNDVKSTLTLQDGSQVRGNTATNVGGGIVNGGTVTVGVEAHVCDNTSGDNLQCAGFGTYNGAACPNPSDGVCPG